MSPPSSGRPTLTLPVRPQVKQLRLEREREKAMREQELELLQREKEAEHFKTWEEQEDNFHLQQAKLRCVRRRGGPRAFVPAVPCLEPLPPPLPMVPQEPPHPSPMPAPPLCAASRVLTSSLLSLAGLPSPHGAGYPGDI